ncbi:MAG: chemotaxis protein CheD [Pseudomonadota bacterium]
MSESRVLVARIGQMQVTHTGDTLKAIMGSCVGVGLLWPKRGVYALSHCLLANSSGDGELNAKYVSDAVPMMLAAMGVETRRDRFSLKAVVVGGGNMLQENGTAEAGEIGPGNLNAAREHLAKHDIIIDCLQDAEGNASQLFINGETGEYEVVLIPKLVV